LSRGHYVRTLYFCNFHNAVDVTPDNVIYESYAAYLLGICVERVIMAADRARTRKDIICRFHFLSRVSSHSLSNCLRCMDLVASGFQMHAIHQTCSGYISNLPSCTPTWWAEKNLERLRMVKSAAVAAYLPSLPAYRDIWNDSRGLRHKFLSKLSIPEHQGVNFTSEFS
jgi:hypothetical protein